MDEVDFVSQLVGGFAVEAMEKAQLGELHGLGQIESYIKSAVDNFLSRYGPEMSARLAALAEPAAKKAAEVVGPVVEQKLKDYTPTFAAVTGGVVALAILLGIWISKRTYERRRR